ncbi:RNI-like protein [Rhizodiscina lignyota]|uniref:RNI-like protein n=1 Tax=Rhizodiscina lignyota TaxID=1504668 RepID=A0A9P4I5S5_9PEZI|nr:RNI-like protein [Rhizodiscina lignyota]
MRRWGRPGAGGMTHAHRAVAAPVPDSISLIRSFDSETMTTRPVRPSPLTASTVGGLPLDLLDRLRSFPLFVSAPDNFLAAIGAYLRPQLHNPHDYILTEGDDAKAMYWLVRGAVRVTSRDGESTYAELKPGAFFGEIGILMDMPRTATIIAKLKSLVVRLNKEDLQKVLPQFPEVERAIREEAVERLAILERQKKERRDSLKGSAKSTKRPRESSAGKDPDRDVRDEGVVSSKKRKSPSPGIIETVGTTSLFRTGALNVRQLLKELPLFSELPQEILHFIGLNAEPRSYAPFTNIVKEGTPGRDIYFILSGEVEVVNERPDVHAVINGASAKTPPPVIVKARLRSGQYFGEVTSLSLAPTRTATVRSVSSVECLMIPQDVLNELWSKCSPDLRANIESVARQRLQTARDNDVSMADVVDGTPPIDELALVDRARRQSVPTVTFTGSTPEASPQLRGVEDKTPIEPYDPDPYLNVDLENVRSRSRRGSLAPPSPSSPSAASPTTEPKPQDSPSKVNGHIAPISRPSSRSSDKVPLVKRPRGRRIPTHATKGPLPDNLLIMILDHLDIPQLMQARAVSSAWRNIINTSPDLVTNLDLTPYNRFVTDSIVKDVLCPFVNGRPKIVDLNNCFHLTDEGFSALAVAVGENVRVWRMKSVWDVTGQAVLEMVNRAKALEEIDLSNCRKVGDNLLARVVGWVVPEIPQQQQQAAQQMQMQLAMQNGRYVRNGKMQQPVQQTVPPGTVIGCPALKALTLSYCKHITDRSMAHIAAHAAARLESIDLTRCTTITDAGFQHWSVWKFPNLKRLVLADCTYLTDQAIVGIVGAARGLKVLDLSFCCALSDTSTEILALGLPNLTHLNLAFCGSAVSDASLRAVGLHLLDLQELSVRGCVRVTKQGVRNVVDGCSALRVMDVSQCRNLEGRTVAGFLDELTDGGRVKFVSVADGRFRGA